jgi:hypothetical protein
MTNSEKLGITFENIMALGAETIARRSARVYINYLYYMNGGGGYTKKAVEKMEARQKELTLQDVEGFARSVVRVIDKAPETCPTKRYFQKAYAQWFAPKK